MTRLPGEDGGGEDRDELLAADRRTMVIGAVVVVAMLLVGLTSAALFTRSACAAIEPDAVVDRVAGKDLEAALAAGLPDLGEASRSAIGEAIGDLAAHLGPLSGAADVTGAERVAVLPTGWATTGSVSTVLDVTGAGVTATADTGGATVVGDGSHLYALRLVNELTGQVDALQPLDVSLRGLTCQDTATVATPLAFHLDADDGELLLLRIDEDGGDADLQLRDPVAGSVWRARFDAGQAPAGTIAARLDGALGPTLAVAARRSTPDDDGAVVTAVDRATGAARWTLDRAALLPQELRASTVVPQVLLVSADRVLLRLAVEVDDENAGTASDVLLVALDAADGGAVLGGAPLPGEVVAVEAAHGRAPAVVVTSTPDGGTWSLLRVDDDGVGSVLRTERGGSTALTRLADGRLVLGTDASLVVLHDGTADAVPLAVSVSDLAVGHGRVGLLLRQTEPGTVTDPARAGGDGAVLVVFGAG